MGKKGGSNNEAKQARKDEEARQARIREGTARINTIFDGGTTATGQLASGATYDPTAKYYNADGTAWTPTAYVAPPVADPAKTLSGLPGNLKAAETQDAPTPSGNPRLDALFGVDTKKNLTEAEQFAEAVKGGKLYSGVNTTDGFNDEYYGKRKQAYIDYASPQLEDQYANAQKELTFALARGGLLDSSVRGEKTAELQQKYDLNKQQIADQALSYETEARNSVEDARSNLIATLNATGDAQGAANSAIARASALSKPAAYSPLSQLFADFTSTLGTQAALERANMYAGSGVGASQIGRYQTGLFTPAGAVQVKK